MLTFVLGLKPEELPSSLRDTPSTVDEVCGRPTGLIGTGLVSIGMSVHLPLSLTFNNGFNGFEGFSMDWAGPIFSYCFNMLLSPIALVTGKAILRVFPVILVHKTVPGYLGYNGGRGNGG